jgi:large subunit ribosomal protein L25
VYYGHGLEPKSIEVPHKDFSTVVRGRKTSHLFDLGLGSDSIAVIRQIQRKVLKDDVYFNLDFMHVNMKEKVTVDVHLEFAGIPIGVKDDNGVLGHPLKAVKIECLPADIPEKVTIDVSALRIGDSVHVRDISIPNIVLKHSPDDVLAVVTHPTREAAAKTPEEEATAAAAAAPAAGAAKPAAAAAKPAAGKK